jgi:hypothetical protein
MKTVVCICLMASALAIASSPEEATRKSEADLIGARATSRYMGTNLVTELRFSEISDSPRWTGDTKPPLSPREAESVARTYLERSVGPPPAEQFSVGTETWHLSETAMRRWFNLDFWFYELKFRPFINGSFNHPPVTVFVTMHGRVASLRTAADPLPRGD